VDVLLAIGACVVLAWGAVVFARGGLLGGALIVLLAGCCFGRPFFSVPLGPFPLTADRLLLVVLLAQYFVYRRWGRIEPRPLGRSDYLLAALVMLLGLSTFTHDYRTQNGAPVAQLVFDFVLPALIYWVARESRYTPANLAWVMAVLIAFGCYVAGTAIAETHQWWELVWPRYIASAEYPLFLGRGRGPLLNPVGNGILLGTAICAALVSWPSANRLGKMLIAAALPLLGWGVVETLTRSAWIGAVLGAVVVAGLALPRGWRVAVVGTSVAVAAIASIVGWDQFMAFKRDRDVGAAEVAESARLRPILAVVAWHMFLDRPVLGCGFGQYPDESLAYVADRTTDVPLEKARPYGQHNAFLALLTETGLAGMGLFVALLGAWIRSAWRVWRVAANPPWARRFGLFMLGLMAVYLPNAMFHDVSVIPNINMVVFYFGGAITGVMMQLAAEKSAARLRLWMPESELVVPEPQPL
jgi:hypothetical protein